MNNSSDTLPQIVMHKNFPDHIGTNDILTNWLKFYFEYGAPVATSSKKEKTRDLTAFISYLIRERGNDRRSNWTPRISLDFIKDLQNQITTQGARRYNDRSINRKIASLKSFSKWIHAACEFPLGDPMTAIREFKTPTLLDVDCALTKNEYRDFLDHADRLLIDGGLSIDRNRYRDITNRPRRKNYRPYRNRAIIYCLLETGMRRAAVTHITLDNIDWKTKKISTLEKGGHLHSYKISEQGLKAIDDYIEHERSSDETFYSAPDQKPPYLFLSSPNGKNKLGQLTPQQINRIWNEIRTKAGAKDRTPHSARHAMGRHIQESTGNPEAIQKQLGHKNVGYSLSYARITDQELERVLENR